MQATFKNLVLDRPLAVIDLETTGTDTRVDRIVEISILKVYPDGRRAQCTRRLSPGIPISAEATAVHGITEADVADAPRFAEVAPRLLVFLNGCDLCGFNLKRFDLRILYVEFGRAGLSLSLEGRALVDPMQIFHARERRDLEAAVRFYCGREHLEAHAAAADALAAVEVLDAMLDHYADLPRSIAGLHQEFNDSTAVDSSGFFTRVEGEIRFAKGKQRGLPLQEIARTSRGYLEWMLNQDFFEDTKEIVRQALRCAARPA